MVSPVEKLAGFPMSLNGPWTYAKTQHREASNAWVCLKRMVPQHVSEACSRLLSNQPKESPPTKQDTPICVRYDLSAQSRYCAHSKQEMLQHETFSKGARNPSCEVAICQNLIWDALLFDGQCLHGD